MIKFIYVLLLSAVPLIEQRGAIPLGTIVYHLNPFVVFLISLIGSLLPAPLIFFFVEEVLAFMKKFKTLHKITNFIERKIQKGAKKLESYMEIGLITFVGIPLPTTGVWTGTAAAAILGLDFKKSMICVSIGAVISAIIITIISVVMPAIFGF